MEHSAPHAAYTIAARHRIPPSQVRPLPRGAANHVLALGRDLVLRLPRTSGYAADLRKEALLIPIVHRAGVRTPALVEFADPRDELPHMLLERAPGTDMAHHEPSPGFLEQVGRQLARIHRIPTAGLPALPRNTHVTDPAPLVERLHRQGHVDAGTARWLESWCDHLATRLPADPVPCLVHGDLAPQNLMATPAGEFSAVVDWGDAALADPATDFAKLPPHWLPRVLHGYRRTVGGDPDHPWETRILWHHLTWALARLGEPVPQPGQRHWTAPPASRLLGLLRLFTANPPTPWTELAPSLASKEGGRRGHRACPPATCRT
ncbi:hypothetical protein GCM10007079_20880 [Nocardiopsis terrae]|uniref:Ser/Thr protein kinase RdoA (MazF antagonist) n=1 Tax=Nocardiopsis terrae TaxID=372655 RepID=A0ABR9HHI2_9ACTN|nr:aminoglycoside phosphotransferase family protein [Nocardiopsis terrae]MBE1458295.1 Ser/Thr protein kinase RdoA (MazF antagonist) [Nocardiopsis terrae]GHC81261.1 hypothetical protein GCM10007079_20880 [Nocardiopsis terrae]